MTDAQSNLLALDASPELTHSRLLGARLFLHGYLRLALAVIIVLGALFARNVLGIENLDVRALLVLAAVIAAYDALGFAVARRYRRAEASPRGHARIVLVMYTAIVLDFVCLTVAIWLVGGTRSPFLAFYLLHVTVGCILFTRRAALAFTLLAYAFMVMLVLGEWLNVIPPMQPIGAIGGTGPIDGRYAFTVLAVYGMLLVALAFLLLTLTARLREGERRVRRANVELERLSNMRRDFLHIALHNIQSPIGAVTMYLQNMRAGLGGSLSEKQGHWVGRSLARLDGLNEFLQNFRMLNSLESRKIDAESTDVDMGVILREIVEEYGESAAAHSHRVQVEIDPSLPPVRGIDRLLREAAVNYVANAIKYTPDGGRIVVRALDRPPLVRVEVEDDGIGIAEEDQGKLFGEFVRLDRAGTPVAGVAGSGLGLSIVRRVMECFGGRAFVESAPGKGSTFVIELPAVRRGGVDAVPPTVTSRM